MAGRLYSRPRSCAADELTAAAPTRWPQLLDGDVDAAAAVAGRPEVAYRPPCELVPAGMAPAAAAPAQLMAVPRSLAGAYFGGRSTAPAQAAPAAAAVTDVVAAALVRPVVNVTMLAKLS